MLKQSSGTQEKMLKCNVPAIVITHFSCSVSEISSDDEAVWKLEVKGEWEIMIGTTCEASLAFQDPDFILTLGCDSITLQQLTNAIVPVPGLSLVCVILPQA